MSSMRMKMSGSRGFSKGWSMLVVFCFFAFLPGIVLAGQKCSFKKNCTKTSKAAFRASMKEAHSDYWVAVGKCYNMADSDECKDCLEEAQDDLREAEAEAREMLEWRRKICALIGEDPYNPEISPENFVDTEEIGSTVAANPYFPLIPGNTWVMENDEERIVTTVTYETKEILGVTCAIVHDVCYADGEVVEDTFDWYAQDIEGNVWYFGESSKEYEDGDLISIEGSWKAGVDGAKPGIVMEIAPAVGDVYRQEFAFCEAEDMAGVVSLGAEPITLYSGTYDDVLKTKEFTPIEPGVIEFKYYVPGIGVVVEENPETGEFTQLVDFFNSPPE